MTAGNSERRLHGARRRLVRSMRSFAGELESYIAASSRRHAMHRTDLTALAVVMDETGDGVLVTPGRLSDALQLSAPATSAMVDRLEHAGHLHRTPHPTDRRSTVLELTEQAWAVGGEMFRTFGDRLAPVLDDYTEAELELVAGFLARAGEAARSARAE